MFDTADTVSACISLFADMVPHIRVQHDSCREAARQGFATATDLADYLVRAGLPFRDAHEVVGNCVSQAIAAGCDLSQMPLAQLQQISPTISRDVYDILTLEGSVAARDHIGGTAPDQVRQAVVRARQALTKEPTP